MRSHLLQFFLFELHPFRGHYDVVVFTQPLAPHNERSRERRNVCVCSQTEERKKILILTRINHHQKCSFAIKMQKCWKCMCNVCVCHCSLLPLCRRLRRKSKRTKESRLTFVLQFGNGATMYGITFLPVSLHRIIMVSFVDSLKRAECGSFSVSAAAYADPLLHNIVVNSEIVDTTTSFFCVKGHSMFVRIRSCSMLSCDVAKTARILCCHQRHSRHSRH